MDATMKPEIVLDRATSASPEASPTERGRGAPPEEGGRSRTPGRGAPVLAGLEAFCRRAGLGSLAHDLRGLGGPLERELERLDGALQASLQSSGVAGRAAAHLMAGSGKRVRALILAIASELEPKSKLSRRRPRAEVLRLAWAVELVHGATLLHDDVVDEGDTRRGAPASRILYGNAASIFAGDWLLIEALRQVRAAGIDGLFDRLLLAIEEMIIAESVQLESRGRIRGDLPTYLRVVEGKTASLFRWSVAAGGRAAGLSGEELDALDRYGLHLGTAFQVMDDILDFPSVLGGSREGEGAPLRGVGKTPFADLRGGKMTHPLIIGLERDRDGALQAALAELVRGEVANPTCSDLEARVLACLRNTSAFEASIELVNEEVKRARSHLAGLEGSAARTMLEAVAEAVFRRDEGAPGFAVETNR